MRGSAYPCVAFKVHPTRRRCYLSEVFSTYSLILGEAIIVQRNLFGGCVTPTHATCAARQKLHCNRAIYQPPLLRPYDRMAEGDFAVGDRVRVRWKDALYDAAVIHVHADGKVDVRSV